MFSAEDSGSGYHPIMYETRKEGDHGSVFSGGYMWALIIVVIFLVIIFFAFAMMFKRDGRRDGVGGIAEIAALGTLNNGNVGADARAAFTEINGRFNAVDQAISHINDVNDLRDLKRTQADLSLQIANNRTDTLLNFKDLNTAVLTGNAGINTNIDNVRFQNQQNTCEILRNNDSNTRAVLDRLAQDTLDRVREELAREREARARDNLAASQLAQTASIISAVRPYPTMAYNVLPPIPVPVGYAG